MAGLHDPLPTLRRYPRGCRRTARGRCGSLFLHRSGLSPPTPCQSPGALPRFLLLSPVCETDGMAPAFLRALFVIVAASASDCGAGWTRSGASLFLMHSTTASISADLVMSSWKPATSNPSFPGIRQNQLSNDADF